MEKQVKKRAGQSLAELEEQTSDLRDSIKACKEVLGPGSSTTPEASDIKNLSTSGMLPKWLPLPSKGIFDRVLLAAGVITVMIGVLCLLVLIMVRSVRKKKTPSRNENTRVVAQYEEEVKRKIAAARNAYPDSFPTTESESAALAAAVPPSDPAPLQPPLPPNTNLRIPAQASDELRALVLKAKSEGVDEKEISRRYRISIDQVALIIKMSGK